MSSVSKVVCAYTMDTEIITLHPNTVLTTDTFYDCGRRTFADEWAAGISKVNIDDKLHNLILFEFVYHKVNLSKEFVFCGCVVNHSVNLPNI